jgi:hypothetical protein
MWLRISATVAFLVGAVLLAFWPWILHGQPHPPAPGIVLDPRFAAQFKAVALGYFGMVFFSFVAAAALAMLIVREVRERYRVAVVKNMRDLIDQSPGEG